MKIKSPFLIQLPRELERMIYSFLTLKELKKANVCIEIFHEIINFKYPKISSQLSYGIYYNLSNQCFSCGNKLNDNYILNMCLPCVNIYNECYSNYPIICNNCVKPQNIKTGEQVSCICYICKKSSNHIGITSYSNNNNNI